MTNTVRKTELRLKQPEFLPTDRNAMNAMGWDQLDILLVSGDAYVDHPSFGAALLGRWLVHHGFRVGIVAQPPWDNIDAVTGMGRPRLFAGVTAGALDSMLAHYTAFRKKRHDDSYTPGGKAGARPNRATIVYTGLVRRAFPRLPVIIGGVEASMRRATHYDFWTDRIRRSVLLDSKANLLIYGMAEVALLEVANRLAAACRTGTNKTAHGMAAALAGIPGSVFAGAPKTDIPDKAEVCLLPSHEEILADDSKLMTATLLLERQVHHGGLWAAQSAGDRTLIFAPPARPLTEREMGTLYDLRFARAAHPSYQEAIPACEMIRFSITTHRGCGGGCSFCSIALHQGRRIVSRSGTSITAEVQKMVSHEEWKGSLSDIGGPTANMWGAQCLRKKGTCERISCLYPDLCVNFRVDQGRIARLLGRVAVLPGVRHVRVASGVRPDLALAEPEYVRALALEFIGGQLKIAPEHMSRSVLQLMRKPEFARFEEFLELFTQLSDEAGKEQYILPYLISAFPGCTDDDMRELAAWLKTRHWEPRQVQCFVPTPGTVATAMYFTKKDSEGRPIHVAATDAERLRQHGILPGRQARRKRGQLSQQITKQPSP